MKEKHLEMELDYLTEMMTIGAGNAATALEQLLHREIDLKVPSVKILSPMDAGGVLGRPSMLVSCVVSGMLGDVTGDMFFVMQGRYRTDILNIIMESYPGSDKKNIELQQSMLTEVANIIYGVFLTAIHDFCKLAIFYTIPFLATDMFQSLVDESIAKASIRTTELILIECEFIISEKNIKTHLILIPSPESIRKLIDSMQAARKAMEK
jgi:chemotaxis protein CheC